MSKSRGHRRKQLEKLPSPKKHLPKRRKWWTPIEIMWRTGSATLFLVSAAIVFWPRMTVEPSGQFDPDDSYSESFTIRNTGIIPIMDMSVSIGLCSIGTVNGDLKGYAQHEQDGKCPIPKLRIGNMHWSHQNLMMDEPFQFSLNEKTGIPDTPPILSAQFASKLTAADIIVIITYQPWFLPIERERGFRFVAEIQSDDKIMWKAKPLDYVAW